MEDPKRHDNGGFNSTMSGQNAPRRKRTHFKVRKRRGSHVTVTGKYPSPQNEFCLFYEGFRERDFFVLLAFDPDVERVDDHPVRIEYRASGRAFVYKPDALVRYVAGSGRRQELIEIKMVAELQRNTRKYLRTFRAGVDYARQHSMHFRVVTDRQLPRPAVRLLRFLLPYRAMARDSEIEEALLQSVGSTARALQHHIETLEARGYEPAAVICAAWRLAAHRQLRVDLAQLLSVNTIVAAGEWTSRSLPMLSTPNPLPSTAIQDTDMEPKIIPAGGSPVTVIEAGQQYRRLDSNGTYTVVQFQSCDDVLVRELGSGALHSVPIASLRAVIEQLVSDRLDLELDGARLAEAEKRYKMIEPLIDKRRVRKTEWEETAKANGVSVKQLRKWHRRYRLDPRLSSLTRKRRTDSGATRLNAHVEKAIKDRIDLMMEDGNLRLTDIYEDLQDDVDELKLKYPMQDITMPVMSTLFDRYHARSPRERDTGKLGKRQADLLHRLRRGSLQDIDHPLAVVQVDHLEIPVIVVDEEQRLPIGRPWLTLLIDTWSRCICGFYITLESPGNLSLGMGVSHAVLPKDDTLNLLEFKAEWPVHGIMWAVHADNAGEFHGNMFELAAKEYGFEIILRKVKQPQYGAYIESYLGTLSGKLRRIPGATREGKDALGDYDPSELAVMSPSELTHYLVAQFVEYHASPHSQLFDASPLETFKEGLKGNRGAMPIGLLRRPGDPIRFKLDFLPADERVISEKGVVWDYIWYMDDCLQRWVNARDPANVNEPRKFLFRRDPRDITRLYFWNPEDKEYRVIRTRNVTRPQMSLWEFSAIRRFLLDQGQKDIDEDVIFAARKERNAVLKASQSKTAEVRRARERERLQRAKDESEVFAASVSTANGASVATPALQAPATNKMSDASKEQGASPLTPFEEDWSP